MLDVVLIVGLIGGIAFGVRRGFSATLGLVAGMVLGGVAAWLVIPWLTGLLPTAQWRMPVIVFLAVLLPVLGGRIGGYLGLLLRRGVDVTPLRLTDRALGAVITVAGLAIAYSLAASLVVSLGIPGVAPAVASSRVVNTINVLIPPPVERAIAGIRNFEIPQGLASLGDVFGVGEPEAIPEVDTGTPAIKEATRSVTRISGVALACGVSSTGSGFVVGPGMVMTNAHVVAGVTSPVVQAPGGFASDGEVVYFDDSVDIAVIRLSDEGPAALSLTDNAAEGDESVVAGYPFGGPLTIGGAKVLRVGEVPFMEVDGTPGAPREMYALAAEIQPGNSGGPVLTASGEVSGMVFARSADTERLGYAISADELRPVIAELNDLRTPVTTGSCSAS